MTGQDLINYIEANHLEECEIAFGRGQGEAPDRCYGGISVEEVQASKGTIYVF